MKSRGRKASRGKRKSGTASKSRKTAARKTALRKTAARKSLKPKTSAKRSRAAASKTSPLDSWIVAGAQGLGLKIEKSWMAAIRANLRVTLDQGVMVAEYPLSDHAEPAPVFRA